MQVINTESSKGVTQRALRAGSFVKPKGVRDEGFEEFIKVHKPSSQGAFPEADGMPETQPRHGRR
jgi:hypothetical protein